MGGSSSPTRRCSKARAGTPRRILQPGQFVVPLGGLRGVAEASTISAWERSNWRGQSPGSLGEAQESVQRPWWRRVFGDNSARLRNREERERYMDSLEWQMEHQRKQIERTLDRTTADSGPRRKALVKLRSSLPSFPGRTPVRGAAEHETPTELIQSETSSARKESPRKRSEPRSRWRRMFDGP